MNRCHALTNHGFDMQQCITDLPCNNETLSVIFVNKYLDNTKQHQFWQRKTASNLFSKASSIVISYGTEWRRPIGCLKLQVIFRKRATHYRALLWKMTYKDKACYDSTSYGIGCSHK